MFNPFEDECECGCSNSPITLVVFSLYDFYSAIHLQTLAIFGMQYLTETHHEWPKEVLHLLN